MADFTLVANANIENGQTFLTFTGSGSTINIKRGDRVRFQTSAGSSVNVAFQGVTTTFFTANASPTLAPNVTSAYYTIKSTAVFNQTFILSARVGTRQLNTTFRVIDNVDITPDDFTLGAPQEGLDINADTAMPSIIVSGINTNVTVSGTNAIFSISPSSNFQPQMTGVSNNTRIYVRGIASPNYNTTVTVSVTIGTLTRTTTLKTKLTPQPPTPIPFHRTQSPVSMVQIFDFFGGVPVNGLNIARNMRAYNKGGLYVPDIDENWRIPRTGNLSISNYLSSSTLFYFTNPPTSRTEIVDTTGAIRTQSLTWGAQNAWEMGYSPFMSFNAEYFLTLNETSGAGFTTGIVTSLSPFNQWGPHYTLSVTATCPANTERIYAGSITLSARHKQYTGYTNTVTFGYKIVFITTN